MNPTGALPPLRAGEHFTYFLEEEVDEETGEVDVWGVCMELKSTLQNGTEMKVSRVVDLEEVVACKFDLLRSTVNEMVVDLREAVRQNDG